MAWFKKGSGTVVRSSLRAVPATVHDPFLNHADIIREDVLIEQSTERSSLNDVPKKTSWLTRGVLAIGLASLFSDISHEMATVILPTFLVSIGGSAAALGAIEGFADFFSSVAKLYAGYIGGRIRNKKWAASGGYFVTAMATGTLALATAWPHVLLARVVGWLGRGFRGPLRDTLMAEQTAPEHFGKAYGLERALDSVGAVIGPICCVVLLWCFVPLHVVFALTLVPGLTAAALMLWGSREVPVPVSTSRASTTELPPVFRRFLVAVALFGLGDFSRTLLILWATGEKVGFTGETAMTVPVLLYVLYNLVAAASSYISGHGSDIVGRKVLLVGGYATAAVVSILMVLDVRSIPMMILVFVGSGIYMGIQEAIERATAADLLPKPSRSFGFGVLASTNGVGDLVSSLTVGTLWHYVGPTAAFAYSAVFLTLGLILLTVWVPSRKVAVSGR